MNVTSASSLDLVQIDLNTDTVSPFNNLFDSTVNDGNTFAFVDCSSGNQLFHQILYFNLDNNIGFDVNVGGSPSNVCLRYGDDTNALQTAQPRDAYTVYDAFLDGDFTSSPTWAVQSGTWNVVGNSLQWQSGSDDDAISVDLGSSFSYADGLLIDANFSVCLSCNIGINTNASHSGGSADGYETEIRIGSAQRFRMIRITGGVNTTIGSNNFINVDANQSVRMTRNSSAEWEIAKDYRHLPANTAISAPFTAGQFLVFTHFTAGNLDSLNRIALSTNFNRDATFSVGAELVQDSNALTITVKDEQTLNGIPNAIIDFNFGIYTTDSSGFISIPLSGIPADANTQFTINIDVNADYTDRDFIFDLNRGTDLTFTALLLETANGRSIEYQIFQPNETTLITNSIVEFRRDLLTFNGLAGRLKTDGSAKLTAFVQDDANYVMRIFDATTTPITQRDYNGTLVNVKIPLNITDITEELTPFEITVGGLAQQTFPSLTADQPVQIFSDTEAFYSIKVDANVDFFDTTLLVQTKGGEPSLELQTFLVPVIGNLATIIFTIDNINQKQTIPGIRIVSETVIDGSLTEVESKISDITGTAEFHFEIGRAYILSFFDGNVLLFSGTLNAKSVDTTLFAALAQRELFSPADPTASFNLNWIPIVSQVNPVDGNITISNIINPFNTIIGDVNVFASHLTDSNIVFETVFTLDSSDQNQTITYDINVSGFDTDFPLTINIQVFDVNGFQIGNIQVKNYSFKTTRILGAFEALREELGAFPIMFIAVILTAGLIGIITVFSPNASNNWVGVLAMIMTAFFVIVTWIPLEAWLVSASMSIGMILWRDREQ